MQLKKEYRVLEEKTSLPAFGAESGSGLRIPGNEWLFLENSVYQLCQALRFGATSLQAHSISNLNIFHLNIFHLNIFHLNIFHLNIFHLNILCLNILQSQRLIIASSSPPLLLRQSFPILFSLRNTYCCFSSRLTTGGTAQLLTPTLAAAAFVQHKIFEVSS
jgi:hypothetical protein